MSTTSSARILVVDDERAQMRALCETLRDQGYETMGFTRADEALLALQETSFDLLLSDLMMPEMDGVELLGAALEIDPHLVGILMTGQGTIETAVKAMQAGALDYILKPFSLRTLRPVLHRAIGVRRLRLENLDLRDTVAIHELTRAIAHTLEPKALLEKILDAALAQLDGSEASIMLLSDDRCFLEVAAARTASPSSLLGTRVAVGEGIAGGVAATGRPLLLEGPVDADDAPRLFGHGDVESAVSLPMMARNKLVGVLNVDCTRRKRPPSLGQIKALGIFTSAAATGIEAARLHEAQRRADARYREVLGMAADGIVSASERQGIVLFNEAAERMFGYRADEVLGQPLALLLPGDGEPLADGTLRSRPGPASDRRRLGRRKDGTSFDVEVAVSRRIEGGDVLHTAVVRDVTERKLQEEKIARLSRIHAVLSGINSAIVRIRDRDDLCREACRIAVEAGGFRLAWIGFEDRELGSFTPASWLAADEAKLGDADSVITAVSLDAAIARRALLERRPIVINDVAREPAMPSNGAALARGCRSFAVLPLIVGKKAVGVLALYATEPRSFDQDELKLLAELAGDVAFAVEVMEKEKQLAYLVNYDPLTGLPNRLLFNARLEQYALTAEQDGARFVVVLLDLERLRNVNETMGRHLGDTVLREVARRLEEASGGQLLAHIGADQFAIATRRIRDEANAARIVETLLTKVFSPAFDVGETTLRLAARCGIAVHPTDGVGAEKLMRNAEAALREAKKLNHRYQFYAPSMNASVAHALHLESRLRSALDRGEFVLHYQPKVDFATGAIVGLEALIRWREADGSLVPPSQFIPLLEETGLIVEAGNWAMREAVRAAAAFCAEGCGPVRVAVNVSAVQLRQKSFVASVEAALATAGNLAHGLDLEITESVIMHDIEQNVRTLDAVRAMGVELAIDDFGTGHSSLAYVGRLPVSAIKIDRAFVRELETKAENVAIVQTIVSLTHALERKVVAEGVETAGQAARLRKLACDHGQGFLFSRPRPAEEIGELLRSRGTLAKPPALQRSEIA